MKQNWTRERQLEADIPPAILASAKDEKCRCTSKGSQVELLLGTFNISPSSCIYIYPSYWMLLPCFKSIHWKLYEERQAQFPKFHVFCPKIGQAGTIQNSWSIAHLHIPLNTSTKFQGNAFKTVRLVAATSSIPKHSTSLKREISKIPDHMHI